LKFNRKSPKDTASSHQQDDDPSSPAANKSEHADVAQPISKFKAALGITTHNGHHDTDDKDREPTHKKKSIKKDTEEAVHNDHHEKGAGEHLARKMKVEKVFDIKDNAEDEIKASMAKDLRGSMKTAILAAKGQLDDSKRGVLDVMIDYAISKFIQLGSEASNIPNFNAFPLSLRNAKLHGLETLSRSAPSVLKTEGADDSDKVYVAVEISAANISFTATVGLMIPLLGKLVDFVDLQVKDLTIKAAVTIPFMLGGVVSIDDLEVNNFVLHITFKGLLSTAKPIISFLTDKRIKEAIFNEIIKAVEKKVRKLLQEHKL